MLLAQVNKSKKVDKTKLEKNITYNRLGVFNIRISSNVSDIFNMNATMEQICRLCLKIAKNGLQGIDETIKLLLSVLLLKLDLGKSRDPIICQDCIEVAKKCLYFKSMCIDTEEIILSIFAAEKKSKYSIKFIYAKKEHIETVNDEDLDICRFCLTRLKRKNFIILDSLRIDAMFEMLTKYMPEMDFKITDNPIICTNCRGSLEVYFQLLLNSMDMEDKIKTYCQERSDNMDLINLDDVPYFLFTNILGYPVQHHQIYKIKEESNRLEDTEYVYPEEYSELTKLKEELDESPSKIMSECSMIPLNIMKLNIDEYSNTRQGVQGNIMEGCPNRIDDLEAKWNDSSDLEINQHVNRSDEIEETKHIASNFISTNDSSKMDRHKYLKKVSDLEHENNVISNDIIQKNLQGIVPVHGDVSERKIYKGTLCVYGGKQKRNINRQKSVHKDVTKIKMYKCSLCTFETKRKNYLKTHMLVHKNITEIKWHKCSLCAYETKYKSDIKKHMLVHKDVSDINMFRCPLCTYEAKKQSLLTTHRLVHKDVSEIKMFKCSLCTYEAKRKDSLKTHMLVHKNVSEIKMFKCSLCTYEAKHNCSLKRHMLVHKDVSEIKMFKCSSCTYEAKRKNGLKNHMLVHKDISETETYKCSLCSYEAKQKYYLTAHMLVHKDISEIKSHKCSLCAYESKYKYDIKKHMLVHKDITETEMYKCSLCAFESKRKSNFKKHLLVHEHV